MSIPSPAQNAPTLIEALRRHAETRPERPAYLFLADGEEESVRLTYAEVDTAARAIAARLAESAEPGSRALLLYPAGLDFATAFLGCLYAGVVAVPAYPPASARHLPRLQAIAADAEPDLILTAGAGLRRIESAAAKLPELADVPIVATDEIDPARAADWRLPAIDPIDLAFLQYTSGSTSTPKGVMVSHGNLVANQSAIARAMGQSEDSVVVGWLPLYHDMGLIGNLLQPLWLGARLVLMSPVSFLQRPRRWLEAISKYRATTSGGPNFAFDLCVQKITAEEREGLDLSSWSLAFSGAEPVRAETLERFTEAFAPQGFRGEAFFPCYGMAETTLLVTGGDLEATPVELAVDAAALERNEVATSADGPRLIGCGAPAEGFDVRIVDPESARPVASGVGEIWIAGPSVAQGYWRQPEKTAHDFGARLDGEPDAGPFLRSGDLGFVHQGELYVTGRIKDLIILRGRNHYPQDLELTAEGAHPALRPGCGAAVSVEVDGEERLVVIYEVARHADDEPEVVAEAVRQAVAESHQVQVYDVVLIRAGTLSKTSSGKVQRHANRNAWIAGELTVVGRSTAEAEEVEELVGTEIELDREVLLAMDEDARREALENDLRRRVARLTRTAARRLAVDKPLTALGLDSLTSVELKNEIAARLDVDVDLATLLSGATLGDLVDEALARVDDPRAGLSQERRDRPELVAGPPTGEHPLSRGQQALWYLQRVDPKNSAYNISGAARQVVGGESEPLDVAALGRALAALAARHPALRTSFPERGGDPIAVVHDALAPIFEAVDATGWAQARLDDAVDAAADRPFDVDKGPLLRLHVLSRAEDQTLILVVHHLVADFWSLGTIARELGTLYAAEVAGEDDPTARLEPIELTFADWRHWQEELLGGPTGERLRAYWSERLGGDPPLLDLPTDRPRPALQTFRGATVHRTLPKALADGLKALPGPPGTTLFAKMMTAFHVLLHRYSGQDDLLVGAPAALRDDPALAHLVGYLVNPVTVRSDLSSQPTFAELLEQITLRAREAFAHRDLPFPTVVEMLAEKTGAKHDAGRSPLFQAMLVFQKDRVPEERGLAAFALGEAGTGLRLGPLELESAALRRKRAQFDLTLTTAEVGDHAATNLEYNTDLFDEATAERLLDHFETLLVQAVKDPARRIGDLPILPKAERVQLLVDWGTVRPPVEGNQATLHELVAESAARHPERTALTARTPDGDEESWTYGELWGAASRLARHLRELGVGPECRVAVCVERRAELILGVLGVLASGGAYVPLDPAYPEQRIAFLLEDSRVDALLICGEPPETLPETDVRKIDLTSFRPTPDDALRDDSLPETAISAEAIRAMSNCDHLAYVIYTSGSTGKPKGVAIAHRSAVTMVRWAAEVFPAEDLAGVLASTSVCFDLSVFEIFLPLSQGGRIILASNALEWPSLPSAGEVTLVNTVPSAMRELSEDSRPWPNSVRTINLAGEPLPGALVEAIHAKAGRDGARVRVLNLYGPSEDTTYSTWAEIPRGATWPVIGRPVGGSRAYVVDRRFRLTPTGVPGELLLGGDGLARGYLARPGLTAERFLPDAWSGVAGTRVYRTSDLVRYLPSGDLQYLGRLDHQVKVRGFRIELGEIEAALRAHPSVGEAAVLARRDGDDQLLVAFLQAEAGGEIDTASLRAHLGERLPAFMEPQIFVVLDALPLTPNGKIDRKDLMARPLPDRDARTSEFVAPETEVEMILAEMWAEVLGKEVEGIGIHDSFFELGGHSLQATRVLARVRDAFGIELPVRALLEAPTITGLTEAIAEKMMEDLDEDELAELLGEEA